LGVLLRVAQKLDAWAIDLNVVARAEGLPRIRPCTIRVLGQSALLEAGLGLALAMTRDVDVRADYDDAVRREFERLLAMQGRELDPLGDEIWMPPETRYTELFRGKLVRMLLAEPEAVLVSKACKAPKKNGPLLTQYLAAGPSQRFLKLAAKYQVDLEQFV
jgi:hypothetical protein